MIYNESPNVADTSEANEESAALPTAYDFGLILFRCCVTVSVS